MFSLEILDLSEQTLTLLINVVLLAPALPLLVFAVLR
jgi:hypothetical protein